MKRSGIMRAAIGGLMGVAVALSATAADAQGLLDKILSEGKVRIGMDLSAPPFAYQDQNQQPAGSEVETAQLVAKDLGVELEIVPTIAANRIPNLVTGRVDISSVDVDIAVPHSAFQIVERRTVIFVQHNGEFEPRELELGRRSATHAEVLSGISRGELYVARGGFILKAELGRSELNGRHAH